jgi:Fe2+ or Zn2+ uptake regulation protein
MRPHEAVEVLRNAGKRITPERVLLLHIIQEHPHLDASEIHHLARKENARLSLATVYRTVNLLNRLGLVRTCSLGEDHVHYESQAVSHYHLVCRSCGKVIEIPPHETVEHLGEKWGFKITSAKVELTGYCRECQRERSSLSRKAVKRRSQRGREA